MTQYALIDERGLVAQVSDTPWPTAMPLHFEPCPDDCVAYEWHWDSGKVVPIPLPEITLEEAKAMALQELAAYRYQQETGGITVAGARISTDRESQAMLSGALAYSAMTPGVLIDWKGEDGWTTIDQQTLAQIALAVGAHVQACFSREKAHAEAISALATVESVLAYDITMGW